MSLNCQRQHDCLLSKLFLSRPSVYSLRFWPSGIGVVSQEKGECLVDRKVERYVLSRWGFRFHLKEILWEEQSQLCLATSFLLMVVCVMYLHVVCSMKSSVCFWEMGNWRWLRWGAQVTCPFPPRRVQATGFSDGQESLASPCVVRGWQIWWKSREEIVFIKLWYNPCVINSLVAFKYRRNLC